MPERRDFLGRTEAQLVEQIARAERVYRINATYTGGEGLALNRARMEANIAVDRRQLAKLRGEPDSDPDGQPVYPLSGWQLDRWRKETAWRERTRRK